MRFGFKLILSSEATRWSDVLRFWRAADRGDFFDSGWVFDHLSPAFVGSPGPCYEAWTALSALAQATRRLRLGTLVLGAAHRHPVLLASMALTLDTVSGGRLDLGLGAGWNGEDHLPSGIELGPPGERADRLEETCTALVALLSGKPVTMAGKHHRLLQARCSLEPVQRPHLPICIGGGGERRTLRIAARWAQHWNFPGGTLAEYQRKRDLLRDYCVEAGRDPAEVVTSAPLRVEPGIDPGAVAARAAELGSDGLDLAILYVPPPYEPAALEPILTALAPLRAAASDQPGEARSG